MMVNQGCLDGFPILKAFVDNGLCHVDRSEQNIGVVISSDVVNNDVDVAKQNVLEGIEKFILNGSPTYFIFGLCNHPGRHFVSGCEQIFMEDIPYDHFYELIADYKRKFNFMGRMLLLVPLEYYHVLCDMSLASMFKIVCSPYIPDGNMFFVAANRQYIEFLTRSEYKLGELCEWETFDPTTFRHKKEAKIVSYVTLNLQKYDASDVRRGERDQKSIGVAHLKFKPKT